MSEREELIDLITKAVMDRLRADAARGGGASSPGAGSGAGGGGAAARFAPERKPEPSASRVTDSSDAETRERMKMFAVSGTRGPDETRALHAAGASRVVATVGYCPASDGLASLIDHTLLKPDADRAQIEVLCREAAQNCFASVCVNPSWVPLCRDLLRGTGVKVCTVVGFPFGTHRPEVKAFEARRAVDDGAEEVDMVIDIGAMKSKDYATVERDIAGVVRAVGKDTIVKVILETSMLTREEKIMGCSLAKAAGADFVKTSTGFGGGGATVEDIELMRETVGPDMGVKASGGVRTKEDVEAMVAAGATRIGASAGVKIVRGEAGGKGY